MKMFFKSLRDKSFRSILQSYILVLVIPVITGAIACVFMAFSIESLIEERGDYSAVQLKTHIDTIARESAVLCKTISQEAEIRSLIGIGDEETLPASEHYAVNRLSAKLRTYGINSGLTSGVYIYFRGNHSVMSDSFRYRGKMMDDFFAETLHITEEEFVTLAGQGGKIIMRSDDSGKIAMFAVYPVFKLGGYNYSGAIVVAIDTARLAAEIKASIMENSYGFIIAPDGSCYMSQNAYGPLKIWYGGGETEVISELIGEEAFVAVSKSATGLIYASAVPRRDYMRPINRIGALIGAYVFLCLGVGVIYSVRASKKRYSVLNRLYNVISKNNEDEAFHEIEQALKNTAEQRKQLGTFRARERARIAERVLMELLIYSPSPNISYEQLSIHGIEFPYKLFNVIAIDIENIGNIFFGTEPDLEQDELEDISSTILRSITDELLSPFARSYSTRVLDRFVVVVNFDRDDGIEEAMLKTIDFALKNFGLKLLVSTGMTVTDPAGLFRSYQTALDVTTFAEESPTGQRFVSYSRLVPDNRKHDELLMEYVRRFARFLSGKLYENAREVLPEIFALGGEAMFPRNIAAVTNTLYEVYGEAFKEKMSVSGTRMDEASAAALIHDFLSEQGGEVSVSGDPGAKIRIFIDTNYKNSMLDITFISDALDFAPSYISRAFKRYSGLTVLEYINIRRISHAKSLLRGKSSVKDIAAVVGYANPRAFIRAMQRLEGATPSEYRAAMD